MSSNLTSVLVAVGAPLLKSIIEQKVGGVRGALAGQVVDRLANELGVPPEPDRIAQQIESDPQAQATVQRIEAETQQDLGPIVEAHRDAMLSYHEVLQADLEAEGWLQKRWRPLFAVAFTICFVAIVFTICRAIWIGELTGIESVAGLLITLVAAGCAVLGVQVWQRTSEKKAGIA